ncbi:LOW QUALITY PROTEIN: trophoblast glycoprotein-like [Phascolarctos cinereus]|uniref:LOW QUALITY PROTEIN: trophoblast glycoprotein-like n=1 Tax=Phascolarctos cinereus TaxID=38626 RepID=A0A6P5KM13_PHACI|nr:LOW QUALITY PROTEIN: trophoblast glycoprotein-like [Phascolarctos cinereus]
MVPRPSPPRAPAAARGSGLPGVLGPPPPPPPPPGLPPLLLAPPPLLLLLLLLLLLSTPAAPCPYQCYCFGSRETIRCSHIVLQELPRDLPADAHNLSIVGSNLTVLRAAAFAGEELPTAEGNSSGGGGWAVRLANLTSLLLNKDNIQVVEDGAFWGLPRLASLDLSYNPLSALGASTFRLLPALSVLRLNAAARGLGEQLDAALRGLATLRRLELQANELTHLPPSALDLAQLEVLDAQSNALTGLAPDELRALGRETQGTPTAPGPRGLRVCLAKNPLLCDCGVRALLTLLYKAPWQVPDARSLRCAAPQVLQGVSLLALNESKLSCTQGPQEKEEGDEEGKRRGKEEGPEGNEEEGTEGRDEKGQTGTGEELEASYVFFGIVLALIGVVFLMVLYLNRRGIKRWTRNLREACRDQMEGYHYRYEQDADPRRSGTASSSGTL